MFFVYFEQYYSRQNRNFSENSMEENVAGQMGTSESEVYILSMLLTLIVNKPFPSTSPKKSICFVMLKLVFLSPSQTEKKNTPNRGPLFSFFKIFTAEFSSHFLVTKKNGLLFRVLFFCCLGEGGGWVNKKKINNVEGCIHKYFEFFK